MNAPLPLYGLPALPLAFAALPLYVHVPHFYAASSGLSLATLGGLLLLVRLFDCFTDPWLGWLADRLSRRGLLLLALPLLGTGFVLLLSPPPDAGASWLLLSLLLTCTAYSLGSVAYQAWGSDLGPGPQQRTRLTALREGCTLLGVLLAAALPGVLAADPVEGTARLVWVLPPLLLLAAIAPGWLGSGDGHRQPPQPLWPSLRRVMGDARFRRLLGLFALNGVSAALPATLFLFFVSDVLQAGRWSAALLALYFASAALSLPLWLWLARQIGRVQAWLAAVLLSVAGFIGAGLCGAGDLLPFAVICLACGLALGGDLCLPPALAADHGQRLGQAGACFGLWNLVSKFNLALAAGIALPLLGAFGYQPGSGAGLAALTVAYALLPLPGRLLTAWLLWRSRHLLEVSP